MTETIAEAAKKFIPQTTHNVTELKSVPIDIPIYHDGKGTDKEGKDFTYSYVSINGEKYRVAGSVLNAIKEILKERSFKSFKVTSAGTGRQTKYTVIPLD